MGSLNSSVLADPTRLLKANRNLEMKPIKRSGHLVFFLATLICQTLPAAVPGSPQATDNPTIRLSAQMRNGNILQIEAPAGTIDWKTVSSDGTVTESRIKLSDIARIKLTTNPASAEVSTIRSLVAKLASDDYRIRHRAESQLMEQGKPFEQVVAQARQHEEPEVRYRVDRILQYLSKQKADNQTRFAIDFDQIQLTDGNRLEGDIGDFTITGIWKGRSLTFNRSNTAQLTTQSPQLSRSLKAMPFATKTIQDQFWFYETKTNNEKQTLGPVKPGFVQVTFDTGKRGEAMVSDKKFPIDNHFTFLGTRLACETHEGNVIISGYGFKKSQSRSKSASNYYFEPPRKKGIPYQGVMRIDFCLPGRDSLPATVNSVGMFTEIVVPKHTIVQAYNSAGHVIGLTQSSKDKTSFIGLSSNEPIAYLRVSENQYLEVDKLNRDFAIDDLTYSRPAAAPDLNFAIDNQAPTVITTIDEQRLLVSNAKFDDAKMKLQAVATDPELGEFELPLDNVLWITPPQTRKAAEPAVGFFVMLKDGSVVHCQPAGLLSSSSQPDWHIDPSNIIGVWSAANECRYPTAAAFEMGSFLTVRPLHTVAFQNLVFDWNEASVAYQLSDAKLVTQNENSNEEAPAVTAKDLGLSESTEVTGSLSLADIPFSAWLREPETRNPNTGLLRTKDGQSFVLGGSAGFQLKALAGQQITLSFQDRDFIFEMDQVATLNLPQ